MVVCTKPHGVLLTGYLKGAWQLSEFDLGLFRGLAAIFGITATVLYAKTVKIFGSYGTGKLFLTIQLLSVAASLPFFYWGSENLAYSWIFLSLLLVSRIGLYGFGLTELEFRQTMITEGQRGIINGMAQSMTTLATLVLFALASVLASHSDFHYMVIISLTSIFLSFLVYWRWCKTQKIAFVESNYPQT